MKQRLLPQRSQASSGRNPKGSVLILVVSVLVLLSLIGTAFLLTTRTDRLNARRHVVNTQLDLHLQGLENLVVATVGTSADSSLTLGSAFPCEKPTHFGDASLTWLSSRIPEKLVDNNGTRIVWPYLSQLRPSGGTDLLAPNFRFVSPLLAYGASGGSRPWDLTVDPSVLDADTDDDGIPDGRFFKLSTNESDNIEYYGALRIVDMNSAVNLATARRRMSPGYFTSQVGLAELLLDWTQIKPLDEFRRANGLPDADPLNIPEQDGSGTQSGFSARPVTDAGAERTDFVFGSPEEAMFWQLSRRVENPGLHVKDKTDGYRAPFLDHGLTLAYRFILQHPQSPANPIEALASSLGGGRSEAYPTGAVAAWFDENFAEVPTRSVRSMVTARNPVRNILPPLVSATQPAATSNAALLPKTSVNTAGIVTRTPSTATPPQTLGLEETYRRLMGYADSAGTGIFRSALRTNSGWTTTVKRDDMLKIRSMIAANHMDYMRQTPYRQRVMMDGTTVMTPAKTAQSQAITGINTGGAGTLRGQVWSLDAQPFITELFMDSNTLTKGPDSRPPNTRGYVALELYNPYPQTIHLKGWRLLQIRRVPNTANALTGSGIEFDKSLMHVATLPEIKIEPGQYLVLENFDPSAANPGRGRPRPPVDGLTACYRPDRSGVPKKVESYKPDQFKYVPDIARAIPDDPANTNALKLDRSTIFELMLVCPNLREDAAKAPYRDEPMDSVATLDWYKVIPIDSVMYRGIWRVETPRTVTATTTTKAQTFHYLRDTGDWKFVFPGRLSVSAAPTSARQTNPAWWQPMDDYSSFDEYTTSLDAQPTDIPAYTAIKGTSSLGSANTGSNVPQSPHPAIYLNNPWYATTDGNQATSPRNPLRASPSMGVNMFPYGAFDRIGDVVQVPFIGPQVYTKLVGGKPEPAELTPVTIDAALARDADEDNANNAREQVGRFVPTGLAAYEWTRPLFDYFTTVNNPGHDFSPNILATGNITVPPSATVKNGNWYTELNPTTPPEGVLQRRELAATANDAGEANWPVEGLVNINTAGFRVLSALPFHSDAKVNDLIARSIIRYRRGREHAGVAPFKDLFDLPDVPLTQDDGSAVKDDLNNVLLLKHAWRMRWDSGENVFKFDLSILPTDDATNAFEMEYLMMKRVSNLVTVHSDSFMCYAMVMGWNKVTGKQESVRRSAFILDRSRSTSQSPKVQVYTVPVR